MGVRAQEAELVPEVGERKPRTVMQFVVMFGLVLVASEFVLQSIGNSQERLWWLLLEWGASLGFAGAASALFNALFTLAAMVVIFGFFEWRALGFADFGKRYGEGLLYSSTALIIGTFIQMGAFTWLYQFDIQPLLKRDDFGPVLVVFPLVYMLVLGFFEYWLHRALHDVPFLWRFHAIHHQIENLNAARAYSHWAQDALYLGVITIPLVFLIEAPQQHIALLTTLYLVSNYYMHTDNPAMAFPPAVRHVLADNVYHHYHHSREVEHWGRNYCSFFSFYDRLFGTQHMPENEILHPTGINGYRPLRDLPDYLVRPFRAQK